MKCVRFFYLLLIVPGIFAKTTSISSAKSFSKVLRKDQLVIAFFYEDNKKDKELHEEIMDQREIFKDFGKEVTEVRFLTVNISEKSNASLKEKYKIKGYITFILFKDGDLVKVNGRREGTLSKHEIREFILNNFREEILEIQRQEELERKRRLEEAKINAYYWGSYTYSGPYWGYYGGGYYPYRTGFYWGW